MRNDGVRHIISLDVANNGNRSPGIDSITGELLTFGASEVLNQHLAALYSNMLTNNWAPGAFPFLGELN